MAVLLRVLQALMNGGKVDLAAVHWLWVCTVNGEFGSAALSEQVYRQALLGVDKDVAASLAMLLGTEISRQASFAPDSVDRESLRRSGFFFDAEALHHTS